LGKVVFRSERLEASTQCQVQGAITVLFWAWRVRPKPLVGKGNRNDEFPARFIGIEFKMRDLGVSARTGNGLRGDQHEFGRKAERFARAGDGHDFILDRLAHDLEDSPIRPMEYDL
jgi:hypothetical protein